MKKIVFLILILSSMSYGAQEKQELIRDGYVHQYRVKKGDNLFKISKKFNLFVERLIKINNIENPDLIYIGDRLKVKSSLADQGEKYEIMGDNIWKSKNMDLKVRVEETLKNYKKAKQLYEKSGIEYKIDIELKIVKVTYIKDALMLEQLGDSYYTKGEKVAAIKKYEDMLRRLELYQELEKDTEESILAKVEKIEKILERV